MNYPILPKLDQKKKQSQYMNKKLFVVTNPENGWNCVHKTLYEDYTEKEVREILDKEYGRNTEDELIIHELYNINSKKD